MNEYLYKRICEARKVESDTIYLKIKEAERLWLRLDHLRARVRRAEEKNIKLREKAAKYDDLCK